MFHAGESINSIRNTNVVDAILLNSKRIGHGLNLNKHSYLLDHIRDEKICLEICPISNQFLGYYNDLRVHPAKLFLNYGIKITLSPDDPSFFDYIGVSLDFYICALAQKFDLKDFKLCCYNSI